MNLDFASLDLDGNITARAEGPSRVTGNLNIAALIVAHAYNIQAQGGLAGNSGRARLLNATTNRPPRRSRSMRQPEQQRSAVDHPGRVL
jgi:hypothetical protein